MYHYTELYLRLHLSFIINPCIYPLYTIAYPNVPYTEPTINPTPTPLLPFILPLLPFTLPLLPFTPPLLPYTLPLLPLPHHNLYTPPFYRETYFQINFKMIRVPLKLPPTMIEDLPTSMQIVSHANINCQSSGNCLLDTIFSRKLIAIESIFSCFKQVSNIYQILAYTV